ncbi:IclR family transcriptional regulator [Natrinema halophilum]|uniref:IclR family transcriptional regulator n=1 Tax=Natrinema halophilum TaxID=1699371 RepID=A0A7D5H3H1_9EURY|nr:IclR family transcriptional regulator [Natrinema halophilum]QLG49831.1 IclR family transcriptional regulator [Natrinema halophilum]
MKTAKNPVQAVALTTHILQALKEKDGAGITELEDTVDLSKGAIHNHLTTLEENGFVVKSDGIYELGLQFLIFGEYVRNHNDLYVNGKEPTDALADETGEYAHLSTEQHGQGIKLYKSKGDQAVGTRYQQTKLQKPEHLHHTATGKAILAFLPQEEADQIIDHYGLPTRTENTISTRAELNEELETIAQRGFACNDEEEVEGIRAVGAPVRDRNDRVIGAVSVSAPVRRMPDVQFYETLPEKVMKTANVIEANINMAKKSSELRDRM